MNLESPRIIHRSNSMSPNFIQAKTDDFTFFVLRNKASTSENNTKYEDIFCVVHDSYADGINKDINTFATTQTQRKPSTAERIGTKNGCNLSLQSISLWNPSEQLKNNNLSSDIKTVFNLKLFRDYLTLFKVHPNSSISYLDNKHKVCSVQTETEFLELWKFAKSCAKYNKGVLLLVDLTNNPDDNIINSNDKIPTINDQKNLNADNCNICENFQLKDSTIKVTDSNVQSSSILNPVLNSTTSCSRILTKENVNMKLENTVPSNINSQDFLNKAAPIWFVRYMEQFKQDIIKEVSDQVMVNVRKNLNECPMTSSGHARFEDNVQSENQVYNYKSKSNRQKNSIYTDPKRCYKLMVKTKKRKEKKLEEKLEYNSEDDNSKEKANNKNYNVSNFKDNMISVYMSNNNTTEKKTVNNHDSMPSDFLESQRSSKENLHEPNVTNVIEGNEYRMNCSITEHQMLDATNFTSNTCCCGCDTENISLNSDISNGEDTSTECNFEIVQAPSSEEIKRFFLKNKDKNTKNPSSFYLLTEVPSSRRSPICIDENHFTSNLNNVPTSSENRDLNISSFHESNDKESSVHDDADTKIHNTCQFNIPNKCRDDNINELTSSICKKLVENSLNPMHNINTESKYSNANSLKTNVNDSHTSYMTTNPINRIYPDSPEAPQIQSLPTDSNDLTLSFHSHTTSITDNGLYCTREPNTTTSSHDYSKRNLSNSSKLIDSNKNMACGQINTDINTKNYDKKMSREKSNAKNGKHVNENNVSNSTQNTVEPVRILPETLVTGALHLASFAYGTAREAIVKIRTNSKDDRSSCAKKTRH